MEREWGHSQAHTGCLGDKNALQSDSHNNIVLTQYLQQCMWLTYQSGKEIEDITATVDIPGWKLTTHTQSRGSEG